MYIHFLQFTDLPILDKSNYLGLYKWFEVLNSPAPSKYQPLTMHDQLASRLGDDFLLAHNMPELKDAK